MGAGPIYVVLLDGPVFKSEYLLMRVIAPLKALLLISALILSACGGGTNTAGAGGSGVGGTGITTVQGNVSQVLARASQRRERTFAQRAVAALTDWISAPANAQSMVLEGIQVIGGGQSTTTDGNGNFELRNVAPSDDFALTFVLENDRTIVLPVGSVPPDSRVQVIDVVLDPNRGIATAADVAVEENAASVPGLDIASDNVNGAAGNGNNGNNGNNGSNGNNGNNGIEGIENIEGINGLGPDNAGQNNPAGSPPPAFR